MELSASDQNTTFDFNNQVVEKILEEIKKANEYIRIAVFQIHDAKVFNLLNQKIQEGVRVEIFTLPLDSIHPDVRDRVTEQFNILMNNGGRVHFL